MITVESLSKQYAINRGPEVTMLRESVCGFFSRLILGRQPQPRQFIWALKDVSCEISAGEIVGIVGRNGSGKSTLLKILSKIVRPTSGSMRVNGRVASLLEVGTAFHEELTGRENIYLSGCILGMARGRVAAKFDEIVAFAGVDSYIDMPLKHYSSGMSMRLGFSVAAHLESDILLVDEVIAVGDGEFQKKCLQTMGELRGVGRTVLFVSHNLAAVENLCTGAIWLDNGVVRSCGRPKEVIQEYMQTFGALSGADKDLNGVTRRGTGEARFSGVEFLGLSRQKVKTIASGDTLVIRLHYAAKETVQRPVFGLEVYTQLGTLVAQVHTYNSGVDLSPIGPGSGYIDLELPDLNLAPGRYYISLSLTNLGYIFYDVVDHCATFDVDPSGRYGLNRALKSGAIMCLPCNWVSSNHCA